MDNVKLLDKRYSKARTPIDNELIKECFSGIEERIHSANSRKEAKMIVYDSCRCFELCESEIIPLFFKKNVKNLYEKYWGDFE